MAREGRHDRDRGGKQAATDPPAAVEACERSPVHDQPADQEPGREGPVGRG
jgi:hypothetical protein